MTGTLAIDIGGTKLLAALVEGPRIVEHETVPTKAGARPEAWLAAAARAAERWRGRFDRVGIAVTGNVRDGIWSALNARTLEIPVGTPLVAMAEEAFGLPVVAANDAQAAAWGEHIHGAGQGRDLVYVTVSTGIGAGIVAGGRLLTGRAGLAGSAGQLRGLDGAAPLEDRVSGRWLAAEAAEAGHDTDARGVFAAAERGEGWAVTLVETFTHRVTAVCADLQLLVDPEVIVVGGGIGLSPGFLDRLRAAAEAVPHHARPELVRSGLGGNAGAVGIAALARTEAGGTRGTDCQQERQP